MSALAVIDLEPSFATWMEANGANVSISFMLGNWHVHVGWCRLLSYSDEQGRAKRTWALSRYGSDLPATLRLALTKAIEISSAANAVNA